MKVSMVAGPASNGTNLLWTKKVGPNDDVIEECFDGHFNLPANKNLVGQWEFDLFIFRVKDETNYMFGTQCNQKSGVWDVFNQQLNVWVATKAPCNLNVGWNEIAECSYRDPSGARICNGQPCLHYGTLVVNGVLQDGYSTTEPAGPLPLTFTSNSGFQFQMDVPSAGTNGASVSEYADELDFEYFVSAPAPTLAQPTVY